MAQNQAPEVGSVIEGHMFMGGDPSQEASWRPVSTAQTYANGRARGLTTKEQGELADARAAARDSLNLLPDLERFQRINATQDSGGLMAVPQANRVVGAFDPEVAQLNEIAARLTPQQREAGSGTTSDRDLALFMQAVPSVQRPREANNALIERGQAEGRRRAAYADFLDRYAAERGTLSGADELFRAQVAQGTIDLKTYGATQDPALGPEQNGLPTYPGIAAQVGGMNGGQGPTDIAPPAPQGPQGPGSSPDAPIDLGNLGPQELLALQAGQFVRRADGTVYALPSAPFAAPAQAGDQREGNAVIRPQESSTDAASRYRQNVTGADRQAAGFMRGLVDTATFGLSDEIGAGIDTLLPSMNGQRSGWEDGFGPAYRQNVQNYRSFANADQQDVGGARLAGQVTGGFVPGAVAVRGAGAAAAARPVVQQIARGAAAGAAYGGAYGAGSGQGNIVERVPNALMGAAGGAAIGALAPPVANVLANRVAAPAVNALQSVGRFAGRQIGRAGEAAGVPGATALVERASPNALQSGANKFADRLGAERVNALAPRAQGYRDNRVDPTFVDSLDDGGVGIMRGLNTRQTPAREGAVRFAEGRRDNLPNRVNRIANEEIGSPNGTSRAANEGAKIQRRKSASEINNFGGQPVDLPENVVTALRSQNARTELMNASRRAETSLDPDIRASAPMLAALARAEDAASARLTVREAQEVSRALRESGDQAYRSGNPEGPLYRDLGNAVRNAARDQSQDYKAWLTRYADDSDLLEATTTGRNFVSVSPDPMSARSSDAFVEAASAATPPVRTAMRDAASLATQTSASNPTAARSTLESMRADRGLAERATALGVDAERLSNRAGAELSSLTAAQRASPRVGSESSTNLQDTGVAAGINLVDDIGLIARKPLTGTLSVLATLLTKQGFTDAEAQAIGKAAIDPQQTDRLISMLAQRMTRREARNLARAIRYQVTTSLQSGQQQ